MSSETNPSTPVQNSQEPPNPRNNPDIFSYRVWWILLLLAFAGFSILFKVVAAGHWPTESTYLLTLGGVLLGAFFVPVVLRSVWRKKVTSVDLMTVYTATITVIMIVWVALAAPAWLSHKKLLAEFEFRRSLLPKVEVFDGSLNENQAWGLTGKTRFDGVTGRIRNNSKYLLLDVTLKVRIFDTAGKQIDSHLVSLRRFSVDPWDVKTFKEDLSPPSVTREYKCAFEVYSADFGELL